MRRIFLVAALVAGCTTQRTIGQPNLSVVDATVDVRGKVDILIMIDNSSSTSPKIVALNHSFPLLLERIGDLAAMGKAASFHIGVVDSDLGAGSNAGACRPGGDGGVLRTAPASFGSLPPPAVCDGLVFDHDAHYIDYDSLTGFRNTGTVTVADAYQCISAVGTEGCGFEAPLEAVYRVLTEPSLNPGFLRDDALLVVILMTDEDDCSAPPDTQLFDGSAAGVATYGVLDSFRCTQFGIACDGKPLTGAALMSNDCTPIVGGPLYDVSRYQALFAPGGVKRSADDLIVATIVAPSSPFEVQITSPCAGQPNTPSCPHLSPSCQSTTNATFFADPAVRINAVTASMPNAITGSVCDTDYSPTMTAVADALSQHMQAGCLPGAVVDLANPSCTVTIDGVEAPRCDVPRRLPCWDVVQDSSCATHYSRAGIPQQLRLTVDGAPSTAALSAHCPLYEPTP